MWLAVVNALNSVGLKVRYLGSTSGRSNAVSPSFGGASFLTTRQPIAGAPSTTGVLYKNTALF